MMSKINIDTIFIYNILIAMAFAMACSFLLQNIAGCPNELKKYMGTGMFHLFVPFIYMSFSFLRGSSRARNTYMQHPPPCCYKYSGLKNGCRRAFLNPIKSF